VEKLGYNVPPFDFRVPGVTSITADVHKYGFSAKGASTILYRSIDILKYQLFVYENWPGGIFASPALLGTRPGGSIAAAWAAMTALGEDGYLKIAKEIMETTQRLQSGVNAIPGLRVLGDPHASVFAYGSTEREVNIFAVADQMEKCSWHIDRLQRPDALHAMVTPAHSAAVDRYLDDLREAVAVVRAHPELARQGGAATYGMISAVPLRGMIKKNVLKMMMDFYGPAGAAPPLDNPEDADDLGTKLGLLFLEWKDKLTKRFGN